MKKRILYAALLGFILCSVCAAGTPGKRPDRNPSGINKALFGATLENDIIKQSNKVNDLEEKYENTPEDKKEGFLIFKESVKEKTLREYKKQKEILKDYLASTPADANATKSGIIKENTGGPENVNVEAIEVQFSMENLRNVVLQGRTELIADPTNLQKARKYYDAHLVCLSTIVEMNDEFIQNIDIKYSPGLEDLIKKLKALLKKTEAALNGEFQDEQLRQTVVQIMENQKALLKKLLDVQSIRLPAMRQWAIDNKRPLKEWLSVARLASDTLAITEQAQALVRDFGSDYQQLDLTPPPLIVFEIDLSQFDVNQ